MRTGLGQQVFPGAVLLVGWEGDIVFERAYGHADLFSRTPMTVDTCFDLASLTKPLGTAAAAMILVQTGRLDLDQPCRFYDRMWAGTDKGDLTARQLLTHCAGLPAFRPYYMRLRRYAPAERANWLTRWLVREPLLSKPGERVEYSDLGFILMQRLIETITNQPLDQYLHNKLYRPLGIERLFFPVTADPGEKTAFAATELCPLRGRLLRGEVHDDNAHALGGVGGHAGLFGTAGAVHDLLRIWLRCVQVGGAGKFFDAAVVRNFMRTNGTNWALGFDTPSAEGSSAGKFFSRGSVGHLGFTGTSFWMDRTRALIVILLTNRVHPSRYNLKIRAFRPQLHDAVVMALSPRTRSTGADKAGGRYPT
jgi:serine-type D-Ala-D-Ala carboxypeptidase